MLNFIPQTSFFIFIKEVRKNYFFSGWYKSFTAWAPNFCTFTLILFHFCNICGIYANNIPQFIFKLHTACSAEEGSSHFSALSVLRSLFLCTWTQKIYSRNRLLPELQHWAETTSLMQSIPVMFFFFIQKHLKHQVLLLPP